MDIRADITEAVKALQRLAPPISYAQARPMLSLSEFDEDAVRRRADLLLGKREPWVPSERVQMPTQLHLQRFGSVPVRPSAHAMRVPEMGGHHKPHGGLWTSTLATAHTDGWVWYHVVERDGYCSLAPGDERPIRHQIGWALEPWPAHVLRIETPLDVERLWRAYAIPDPRSGIGRLTLNWEQMRHDGWDALHLPDAYSEHIRFGLRDHPHMDSFYSWDCESTIWFRWSFWTARRVDPAPIVARVEGW